MKHVYAIFDSSVSSYGTPLIVDHPVYAVRYFETLAKDEKSDVGRFPQQFFLYECGTFDEVSGLFQCAAPVLVLAANSFHQEVANAS